MAPLVKEEPNPKSTAESVDIIKSFNKVYNKPCLIPDFSKQINRFLIDKRRISLISFIYRGTHISRKSQYDIKLNGKSTANENKRSKYIPVKDNPNELASNFRFCENHSSHPSRIPKYSNIEYR